jgi:hypothetical protein
MSGEVYKIRRRGDKENTSITIPPALYRIWAESDIDRVQITWEENGEAKIWPMRLMNGPNGDGAV